jgi:hypothetical protein
MRKMTFHQRGGGRERLRYLQCNEIVLFANIMKGNHNHIIIHHTENHIFLKVIVSRDWGGLLVVSFDR